MIIYIYHNVLPLLYVWGPTTREKPRCYGTLKTEFGSHHSDNSTRFSVSRLFKNCILVHNMFFVPQDYVIGWRYHCLVVTPGNLDNEINFHKWMQPRIELEYGAAAMMDSVFLYCTRGRPKGQQGAWRGLTVLWRQMRWNQRRCGNLIMCTPAISMYLLFTMYAVVREIVAVVFPM